MTEEAFTKQRSTALLSNRRAVLKAVVGIGAGLAMFEARSAGAELRVVTSDNGASTRQILDGLAKRVPGFQSSADIRVLITRPGPAFYLAIGPSALSAALDAELGGAPLLALFVSNEAYTRLTGQARRPKGPVSAIFAEADPQNQMAFIRSIYTRRITVGVLLTELTTNQEQHIRRAARANDLDVEIRVVGPTDNALRVLTSMASATVILAVPDRDLYTADSLRGLLESTYRRNQPVIGFSTPLVAAGTLGTVYSNIDDTLAQLPETILAMQGGRSLAPQYPAYWRISINDTVARSLNVVISNATRAMGEFPPPP